MNIIVCVKRVPETTEVDLTLDRSGKEINKSGLVFDLNEWDSYAIEEAVALKERQGGTVTVITLGSEESNESLRKCMAMGADEAMRLTDPAFEGSDGLATARTLAAAIGNLPYDLILTGTQAEDDGFGQVGVSIAEILGIPYASLVNRVDLTEKTVRVHRELEGGLEEIVEIDLPALLTVQSGINDPRYVSIMGIRKVAKKEIKPLGMLDLSLAASDVGLPGSDIQIDQLSVPSTGKGAEWLEGKPDEIARKVLAILRERGGLAQ